MVKTCERAEVRFGGEENRYAVASITNLPEIDGLISPCTGIVTLNGIDYRPVFYWAAQILHLALLPEDFYVEYIHGEREITLDDWKMTMMLDHGEHFEPTTTRKTFFQGIEVSSTVSIVG